MTGQKAGMHRLDIGGVPGYVRVPNDTIDGDGFYVSFNDVDVGESMYGSATTALVRGQMEAFYILNGNHMAQYAEIMEDGFDACMRYFEDNIHLINKRSDQPPAPAAGMGL
jgi:hypothetical protein